VTNTLSETAPVLDGNSWSMCANRVLALLGVGFDVVGDDGVVMPCADCDRDSAAAAPPARGEPTGTPFFGGSIGVTLLSASAFTDVDEAPGVADRCGDVADHPDTVDAAVPAVGVVGGVSFDVVLANEVLVVESDAAEFGGRLFVSPGVAPRDEDNVTD
jgi:hypothetical protein